jgi:hypothetical protein
MNRPRLCLAQQVDILEMKPRKNPKTGRAFGSNGGAGWGYQYRYASTSEQSSSIGLCSLFARSPAANLIVQRRQAQCASLSIPLNRACSCFGRTGFQDGVKRDVSTVYELFTDAQGFMTYAEPVYQWRYSFRPLMSPIVRVMSHDVLGVQTWAWLMFHSKGGANCRADRPCAASQAEPQPSQGLPGLPVAVLHPHHRQHPRLAARPDLQLQLPGTDLLWCGMLSLEPLQLHSLQEMPAVCCSVSMLGVPEPVYALAHHTKR